MVSDFWDSFFLFPRLYSSSLVSCIGDGLVWHWATELFSIDWSIGVFAKYISMLYWNVGAILSGFSVQRRLWWSSRVLVNDKLTCCKHLCLRYSILFEWLRWRGSISLTMGLVRGMVMSHRWPIYGERTKTTRHDACALALFAGIHARVDRCRHVRSTYLAVSLPISVSKSWPSCQSPQRGGSGDISTSVQV